MQPSKAVPTDARDHLLDELSTAFNAVAAVHEVFTEPGLQLNRAVRELVTDPLLVAAEALSVASAMVREWPPVRVAPSRVNAPPDGGSHLSVASGDPDTP